MLEPIMLFDVACC